jgi:hypothetical protein
MEVSGRPHASALVVSSGARACLDVLTSKIAHSHLVLPVFRYVMSQMEYIYELFHGVLDDLGARGSVVVKALCYKPEGRGFDTRWDEFVN